MNKIRLYVNSTKPEALNKAIRLRRELIKHGYKLVQGNEDIVIGLGGDGTLFSFLKDNNYNVTSKYMGVNCGTLGFLQEFDSEDVCAVIKNIPEYIEQKLNFVSLELVYKGTVKTFDALNEFSIHHVDNKSFRASVQIDNNFLENYVGTGFLFSTPTGSTAFSLSAGGAILHPSIEAIQMVPREAIANSKMHTLSKSICLPKGMNVVLKPINPKESIAIESDGDEVYTGQYESITIYYSQKGITKLKPKDDNFIKTINQKLI